MLYSGAYTRIAEINEIVLRILNVIISTAMFRETEPTTHYKPVVVFIFTFSLCGITLCGVPLCIMVHYHDDNQITSQPHIPSTSYKHCVELFILRIKTYKFSRVEIQNVTIGTQ